MTIFELSSITLELNLERKDQLGKTSNIALSMKTDPKPKQSDKYDRIHIASSLALLLLATGAGLLAWYSFANEALYPPFGILATDNTDPSFYFGISVYITIGATLVSTAFIRLAIKLTK